MIASDENSIFVGDEICNFSDILFHNIGVEIFLDSDLDKSGSQIDFEFKVQVSFHLILKFDEIFDEIFLVHSEIKNDFICLEDFVICSCVMIGYFFICFN